MKMGKIKDPREVLGLPSRGGRAIRVFLGGHTTRESLPVRCSVRDGAVVPSASTRLACPGWDAVIAQAYLTSLLTVGCGWFNLACHQQPYLSKPLPW